MLNIVRGNNVMIKEVIVKLSRELRIWFPGAKYHITNRGNRRSAIFYDDHDRLAYLELLEEARRYFPFYLHSYCLMTNHIHLQLETIQHHPKDMMKFLNSRYAMYFNKRHHLVGHVFQGWYGSELIDSADYLLEVSRYIHLNPLEAKMVKSPKLYPWSSYSAYVSNSQSTYYNRKDLILFSRTPKRKLSEVC